MNPLEEVDFLQVEDNPNDAALTIRAPKKRNLANRLYTVEDGAEALDSIFCRGRFAEREIAHPPKSVVYYWLHVNLASICRNDYWRYLTEHTTRKESHGPIYSHPYRRRSARGRRTG